MRASTVRHSTAAAVAAAALLLLSFAGTAIGTPGSGVLSAPVLARGDFLERVDVKIKADTGHGLVVSNAPNAGEVLVQEITIAPNGTTGWHSHPGPVVVVVKSGALTYVREDQGVCVERTYPAGKAFVDPGRAMPIPRSTAARRTSSCSPRTSTCRPGALSGSTCQCRRPHADAHVR